MCNFVGFIKSFPFAYGEAIICSGWYLKYVSLFALLGLTVHASNTYDIYRTIFLQFHSTKLHTPA